MEKIEPLKIIFITLVAIDDIQDRNIYADLMRCFVKNGHHVTIISPAERRYNVQTNLRQDKNYNILRVKCLNIQKTNVFEKSISTFLVDFLIKNAIKKYLKDLSFDLAVYSTPPITLVNTIKYLRIKHSLRTYLLLKDIFPQNAVDLGFIKKGSLIYKYFRRKESLLYQLSDKVGCMSHANIDYVIKHNSEVDKDKVELCPNSIEISPTNTTQNELLNIKNELGISESQRIFIYGGNLGKPQGIDFLIKVLNLQAKNNKAFFIIIGSGTEYGKLEKWYNLKKPKNVLLRPYLPKIEYDAIVNISDVGMIFLDYKFKIPNYPSRLLTYLENKKPILAFTDRNTDIGANAVKRKYGEWSPSDNLAEANNIINHFCEISNTEISQMGENGYNFLLNNYTVQCTYSVIIRSLYLQE